MLGAQRSLASISGRRILVLRAGALGDTLLALPAIGALRRLAGSGGEVEVAGIEPAVRLTLGPGHATAVHSIDRARFLPLFQPSGDDSDLVRFLGRFALLVSWSNLPLLAETLSRLGIPFLSASPHPPPSVHASDCLYRSLAPLGVVGSAPKADVELDEESQVAALEFLRRNELREREFIAIHPSSGSLRKNWPPEKFRKLARTLRRESQPFLWIEGEADRKVVAEVSENADAPVARSLPLSVLAAVLSLARGFVGNDSGVTHLAAAVNVPTLALFGPTDPRVWAPRGPRVLVVARDASVDTVWEKARSLYRTP